MDRSLAILFAVALQVLAIAGMLVSSSWPLWSGTEIRLKTMPVDPRSLFRGNYARLNYEVARLPADALGNRGDLRFGEIVYVTLRESESGIHAYDSISLQKPETGIFIRGRYQRHQGRFVDSENSNVTLRVKYGIEAYFAPKEKALALEKNLRDGGVAVVMVAANGKPALKSVN